MVVHPLCLSGGIPPMLLPYGTNAPVLEKIFAGSNRPDWHSPFMHPTLRTGKLNDRVRLEEFCADSFDQLLSQCPVQGRRDCRLVSQRPKRALRKDPISTGVSRKSETDVIIRNKAEVISLSRW